MIAVTSGSVLPDSGDAVKAPTFEIITVFSLAHPASEHFAYRQPGFFPLEHRTWEMLKLRRVYCFPWFLLVMLQMQTGKVP